MKKSLFLLPILAILFTSCASMRAIFPGGVTASDAEWSGIKTGPAVSIIGSLDSRVAPLAAIAAAFGQNDPIGVLLPLTPAGDTSPRWVICSEKLAAVCNGIPINTRVHFAGQAVGPGVLWRPTRLRAEGGE